MKKILALILAAVSLFAMSLLGGCFLGYRYRDYEEGYFIYKMKSNSVRASIVGLTELGHEQKVIVMPETIAGYKYIICEPLGFMQGAGPAYWGENDVLEKIYFEYYFRWTTNDDYYDGSALADFHNLKKVIFNRIDKARMMDRGRSNRYNVFTIYANYDPAKYQEYHDEIGDFEHKVFFLYNKSFFLLANVEFMYNYEGAPNEGYYWIDDIENGEKIEIIPPEPTREGYTFGGWYTEPECVNEWSFDTVINKPEPVPTDYKDIIYYPENYINFIYAKWIEN